MTDILVKTIFAISALCIVISVTALVRATRVRAFNLKAAVERTVLDHRVVELQLIDGSRWRSTGGIVWHSVPDGYRADLDLEPHLERENERLALVDEWAGDRTWR